MTRTPRGATFARVLVNARIWAGYSQVRLHKVTGVPQSTIAGWEKGAEPKLPWQVFRVEAALGFDPGELSRYLGYVPVGAATDAPPSVRAVILADERLDKAQRTALLSLYDALRRDVQVEKIPSS